jgi:hypothetical protein
MKSTVSMVKHMYFRKKTGVSEGYIASIFRTEE